ncbi:MAG: acyltransferase [Sphingobacterium sp.]|nr:acyltransferase [Sphingobacterium sp.]
MTSSTRVYQIDLFRFIAAMAVLCYHFLYRGFKAGNMSLLRFDEIGSYFKYGYLGVDMFFIISGFVIAFSIKHLSLPRFLQSRFQRLYPVYWLCLCATAIVTYYFGAPRYAVTGSQFLVNTTMIQTLFDVDHVDGAYWSLYVEMKFYLLIVFFLMLNYIKKISLDYMVCVWLFLSSLRFIIGGTPFYTALHHFFILDWSSYFIAGILFYRIYAVGPRITYFALLACCLFLSIYTSIGRINWLQRTFHEEFSSYVIGGAIIGFYILMMLVALKKMQFVNNQRWVKLGMLTYPLYLLHQHIGFIIFNKLYPYMNKYVLVSLVTVCMVGLAYVISYKIEPKLLRWMRRDPK